MLIDGTSSDASPSQWSIARWLRAQVPAQDQQERCPPPNRPRRARRHVPLLPPSLGRIHRRPRLVHQHLDLEPDRHLDGDERDFYPVPQGLQGPRSLDGRYAVQVEITALCGLVRAIRLVRGPSHQRVPRVLERKLVHPRLVSGFCL